MKIRLMKKSDIPFVIEIGKNEKYFEVSKNMHGFWERAQLENWVKNENGVLIIAEAGRKIIGFILSSLHTATGKATFENMWVDVSFRKMGVAQKMTDVMINKLKEKGAVYICGMTKTENKEIVNFLIKNGFDKGFEFYWMGKQL